MPFLSLKDGTKLSYREAGTGKPPLLLVHGLTMNSWVWQNQLAYFPKYYRVIALDLKGHGASDKPKVPYTVPSFTEEINQLAENVMATDKFVLCGHSFGGYIGLSYASDPRFSKKLKGLVLCNTMYNAKGNPAMKMLADSLKKGTFGPRKSFADMFAKTAFNFKFIAGHKELVQTWIDETMKCPDHVAISWMESIVAEYDVTEKLSQIDLPILIITSDNDGQQDPRQSYYMKEHLKNSQLVVLKPGIGHHTQMEAADEFNKAVKGFLEKL